MGSITNLLNIINDNFYDDFEIENIITKAIPEAKHRITALKDRGYIELKPNTVMSFDSYFLKSQRI